MHGKSPLVLVVFADRASSEVIKCRIDKSSSMSASANLAHFCANVLHAGGFPRQCWLPT